MTPEEEEVENNVATHCHEKAVEHLHGADYQVILVLRSSERIIVLSRLDRADEADALEQAHDASVTMAKMTQQKKDKPS